MGTKGKKKRTGGGGNTWKPPASGGSRKRGGGGGGGGGRTVRSKSHSDSSPSRSGESQDLEATVVDLAAARERDPLGQASPSFPTASGVAGRDLAAAPEGLEDIGEWVPLAERTPTPPISSPPSPQDEKRVYRKKPLEDERFTRNERPRSQRPALVGGDFGYELQKLTTQRGAAASSGPSRSSGNYSGSSSSQTKPAREEETVDQPLNKLLKDHTDEELVDRFVNFLKNFVAPGETNPYYPVLINSMLQRGGTCKFFLDFEHVLKEDLPLAIEIHRRFHLCHQCIQKFLLSQGFTAELPAERIELYRVPDSIVPLEEILNDRDKLVKIVKNVLGLNVSVEMLSDIVMALIPRFVSDIRDNHIKGLSWNGEYTIEDMVVVDGNQCRITKKPRDYEGLSSGRDQHTSSEDSFVPATKKKDDPFGKARVNDVKELEDIFTKRLQKDENPEPEEADLPLFYYHLRNDMRLVTIQQVKAAWFWEYLINHPALKPPIIRSNLVCTIHLLCEESDDLSDTVKGILNAIVELDWRPRARDSSFDVLKLVYNYESDERAKKNLQKDGDGKGRVGGKPEPFKNTPSGQIEYERHYIQHAHRIVPGYSISEKEIFFSNSFKYLPRLLKVLMKAKAFQAHLSEAWIPYAGFTVQMKDGCKGDNVLKLSFW